METYRTVRLALRRDGYAIAPNVLGASEIEGLTAEVMAVFAQEGIGSDKGVYGMRNIFESVPAIRRLAVSLPMRNLAEMVLGKNCFAVRAIFFDKVEGANWKVPWHQDLSIAIRERRDTEGYGPWSEKAGVIHAQAPADLLARMVTLRLHLDDCGATNGPLRVLPGTHNDGKLNAAQIQELRESIIPETCVVERGGVILMRPLLLHASSPAERPGHRRVIHLEYATASLPNGLEWHTQV